MLALVKVDLPVGATRGKDKTNHFTVEVYGGQARARAQYLGKGSRVVIDAELDWRDWRDQQGNRREAVTLMAHHALRRAPTTGR